MDSSLVVCQRGNVVGTGENIWGEIGDGTNIRHLDIVKSPMPTTIVAIDTSTENSMAIADDGTVWSWGRADRGQLGNGTVGPPGSYVATPQHVLGLSDVVAVSAGVGAELAVKSDGTVWGWGSSSGLGEPGLPPNVATPVRITALGSIVAVSAGADHILALDSGGRVWAWGDNDYGQLGNGTFDPSSVPFPVPALSGVVAISAGNRFSMAIRGDGTLWSWGENYQGQLGIGVPWVYFSSVPVQTVAVTNVTAIDAGGRHALALMADGSVWAWGANEHGQVGVARASFAEFTPARVASTVTFASIAAGTSQSIAIDPQGGSWVWGDLMKTGNYGNGSTLPSYAPTEGGFDERCMGKPLTGVIRKLVVAQPVVFGEDADARRGQ
jgi:alpha-tubulin suppressor-like RCC1 family protein